ncbi:helix-turn-helix domain-containing protein [Mycobacteroides abscessus]|uniref:helix-turn-helix domain-containing protein n=1 Tax=Mycobacteroides abscessus TaxID=36809 RepID=UPI00352C9CCE
MLRHGRVRRWVLQFPPAGVTTSAENLRLGSILSLAQAVELSTFCDRTLRSAISDGELMAYRRGRRIVIWEHDLLAWLRSFEKVKVTK